MDGCAGTLLPLLAVPLPGAISVQDSSSLDFEASPRLRLVIQAETTASFGFMAINLNLQDVNDNLPRFQLQNYVAFIWESQSYDSPVIHVWLGHKQGHLSPGLAGVMGWRLHGPGLGTNTQVLPQGLHS